MEKLTLRKIELSDKEYFAKWWRDKELLRLTSGILKPISDEEINKYFQGILENRIDYHFMIVINRRTIGHISLGKRANNWYETQIMIGEKEYWGKGCGIKAIQLLVKRAKRLSILKIFLEVRPINFRAIRTYEKCGFIKVGVRKYPENKYLPEVLRMELKSN